MIQRIVRIVLTACVLMVVSQWRATGSHAAVGSKQLSCTKYGYSMMIGSDWTVTDPCTKATIISTNLGFNLGIILRKDTGWSTAAAKSAMKELVAGFDGYTPMGSLTFKTVAISGRRWSAGVVELRDVKGNTYALTDLEAFSSGIIYDFVADAVRRSNGDANAQITARVNDTLSSIKISNAADPIRATPTPEQAAPTPGKAKSGTGSAAMPLPQSAVGGWETTVISQIQYRNTTTGQYGPANGSRIALDLTSDGRYTYSGLLQATSYSCVDALFVHETGTATVDKSRLILSPETSTVTSKDNCVAKFNYTKQGSLAERTYLWKVDPYQRGTKLCLQQDDTKKALACYWRTGAVTDKATIDPTTGASWARQTSGTKNTLRNISCRSADVCLAVGDEGTVLTTRNGGAAWTNVTSPDFDEGIKGIACASEGNCVGVGVSILRGQDNGGRLKPQSNESDWLNAVTCATGSNCVAVGDRGAIITTTDGGATWTRRSSSTDTSLNGVSCTGANLCVAVGGGWGKHGTVLTSRDGGVTWTRRANDSTFELTSVSCTGTSLCVAVGVTESEADGIILTSVNGGADWNRYAPGIDNILQGNPLNGVSCAAAGACAAVGESGTILTTSHGGTEWASQVAAGGNSSAHLLAVSCAGASNCVAVGNDGIILQLRR